MNKAAKVLFIGHPLFFDSKLKGSGYELYAYGKCGGIRYGKIRKLPQLVSYAKDVILDIFWTFKLGKKWDL